MLLQLILHGVDGEDELFQGSRQEQCPNFCPCFLLVSVHVGGPGRPHATPQMGGNGHSSGGYRVQDQGAGGFGSWGVCAWLVHGAFLLCPHRHLVP